MMLRLFTRAPKKQSVFLGSTQPFLGRLWGQGREHLRSLHRRRKPYFLQMCSDFPALNTLVISRARSVQRCWLWLGAAGEITTELTVLLTAKVGT